MPWRITTPSGETFTGDDVTLEAENQDVVNHTGMIVRTISNPLVRVAQHGYHQVIDPTGGLTLEWVEP